MLVLVKYTARRNRDEIETISREIVGPLTGDAKEAYRALAYILGPALKKEIEEHAKAAKNLRAAAPG